MGSLLFLWTLIILVILDLHDQILVKEPPIFDIDGAGAQILMLQKDPNVHLALVIFVTDAEEIVIQYFFNIVWFDILQLLQGFLQFLFTLIEIKHDDFLSLEDSRQEVSLSFKHLLDHLTFVAPIEDKLRPEHHLIIHVFASTRSDQEFAE